MILLLQAALCVPESEVRLESGAESIWVACLWEGVRQGQHIRHGQYVSVVTYILWGAFHRRGDVCVPCLGIIAFKSPAQGIQPELPEAGEGCCFEQPMSLADRRLRGVGPVLPQQRAICFPPRDITSAHRWKNSVSIHWCEFSPLPVKMFHTSMACVPMTLPLMAYPTGRPWLKGRGSVMGRRSKTLVDLASAVKIIGDTPFPSGRVSSSSLDVECGNEPTEKATSPLIHQTIGVLRIMLRIGLGYSPEGHSLPTVPHSGLIVGLLPCQ
jgi:hypothetical protein